MKKLNKEEVDRYWIFGLLAHWFFQGIGRVFQDDIGCLIDNINQLLMQT